MRGNKLSFHQGYGGGRINIPNKRTIHKRRGYQCAPANPEDLIEAVYDKDRGQEANPTMARKILNVKLCVGLHTKECQISLVDFSTLTLHQYAGHLKPCKQESTHKLNQQETRPHRYPIHITSTPWRPPNRPPKHMKPKTRYGIK